MYVQRAHHSAMPRAHPATICHLNVVHLATREVALTAAIEGRSTSRRAARARLRETHSNTRLLQPFHATRRAIEQLNLHAARSSSTRPASSRRSAASIGLISLRNEMRLQGGRAAAAAYSRTLRSRQCKTTEPTMNERSCPCSTTEPTPGAARG